MNSRRPVALHLLLVSAWAFGCADIDLTHESWDSLTEEHAVKSLRSPTGNFKSAEVDEELLTLVGDRIPALIETARFVGHMAQAVDEVSSSDYDDSSLPEAEEGTSKDTEDGGFSTNLYLKFACPGSRTTPPYDFSGGQVRLVSPELKGKELFDLMHGGEFLLIFDECRMGDLTIDARVPGRYLLRSGAVSSEIEDPPVFALALDVSAEDASPLGVIGFACGSATTTCRKDIRVAAEFNSDSGTYVVEMRLTEDYWGYKRAVSITILGANESSSCTFTTASVFGPATFVCETVEQL